MLKDLNTWRQTEPPTTTLYLDARKARKTKRLLQARQLTKELLHLLVLNFIQTLQIYRKNSTPSLQNWHPISGQTPQIQLPDQILELLDRLGCDPVLAFSLTLDSE